MKRYIRSTESKIVDIEIFLEYEDSEIAAANKFIEHPRNRSKKKTYQRVEVADSQ